MRTATPHEGWFTHLAWNIDLVTRGPFVRESALRRDYQYRLASLAKKLRAEGALTAHALAVEVIAPIKGGPRYDLALLVHTPERSRDALLERTSSLGFPSPELAVSARNAGRFGDTEGESGAVLLNHFAGEASSESAVAAWKVLAEWYERALKVNNSTLLEYEQGSPFLIMNYAVLPGRVVPFLAQQLLRPSFHTHVRRRLGAAGISPFPLFARRFAK